MAYQAGVAYITIVPSLRGFQRQVETELRGVRLDVKANVKPEVDKAALAKAEAEVAALSAKLAASRDKEADAAGKVRVAEQKLQDLRAKGNAASGQLAAAEERLASAQRSLAAAQQATARSAKDVEAAQARLLEAQRRATAALGDESGARQAGERTGGAFAEGLRGKLEQAVRSLPDVEIHAHSSEADIIIAEIRKRLAELSNKRIGIDIDEGTALAEIDRLKVTLEHLRIQHPSVQVRADTAEASARLEEIQEQVRRINGENPTIRPDVDDRASGKLISLRTALFALSPAAIPIAAALVPAIAGIGLAAVSALAGIAVLKLGLSGIGDAIKAQDEADASSAQNASTHARQIADAQRNVQDAREAAAEAAINAAERVQRAQQALADAERTSAQQVQRALQQQQQAELQLAQAQRDALRAQQALNDARRDAQRSLEDMQIAAAQADIDQRQSLLSLAQAQQALASANANPQSAPGQVEAAQLGLQQAQLAARSAGLQKSRTSEDLSRAQAAGVEGSPQVTAAQDQADRSAQGVVNAQRQVADAAQDVANAQLEATQKVADAQRGLSDAYREQARSARDSEEAIQRAQEALADAENTNAAAVNKVNAAMAKLTPAGREFVAFLRSVKPQFDSIGAAAQQSLLPGLQAGITALLPSLPQIRDLVGQVAGTMGRLATEAGRALGGPWWQQWFTSVGQQIGPVLDTMGRVLGNLVQGMAGLFQATLPLAIQFGQALLGMSQNFANFSTSDTFKSIMGYVLRALPVVGEALHNIGELVKTVGPPLAEFGLTILNVFNQMAPSLAAAGSLFGKIVTDAGPLLSLLGSLASTILPPVLNLLRFLEPILIPISIGILAMVGAVKAFGIAQGILEGITLAWKLLSTAFSTSPIGFIITLIVGLVAALIAAYQSSEDFRNIVNGVFQAVGDLANIIWVNVLKPIFDSIGDAARFVGGLFKSMFEDYIKPSWELLGALIQFGWEHFLKPVFDFIKGAIDDVVNAFKFGVDHIGIVWDAIKKAAGTPIKWVIDHVYNDGIAWMWNKVADFLHLGHLDPIDTSGIAHFAGGGVLGGYAPGRDVVPALLSPGEAVLVPELVQALGPANILAMNAAYSGGRPSTVVGGVQRFAGGGIVDKILGFIGGVAGDVLKFLTDPIGSIKQILGDNPWIDMLVHIPQKVMGDIGDWLWKRITDIGSWFGGGSKGSSAQLDQWIAAGMLYTSVPASWNGPLHTLIMRESGGNPRAINLTDINAQRGDPSRGLMQTIGLTFNHYRDPNLSADIYDPISNIVAGINYIKANYGSIFNVQQAVGATPKGYAGGGIVPYLFDQGGYLPPGLSTVYNATRKPEPLGNLDVLAAQFGGAPGGEFTGTLVLDSGEFLGRVRGEIQSANRDTGRAIAYRPRNI